MYKVKQIRGIEEYEKFLNEINQIGAEIVNVNSTSREFHNLKGNGIQWDFVVTYKTSTKIIDMKENKMFMEEVI